MVVLHGVSVGVAMLPAYAPSAQAAMVAAAERLGYPGCSVTLHGATSGYLGNGDFNCGAVACATYQQASQLVLQLAQQQTNAHGAPPTSAHPA